MLHLNVRSLVNKYDQLKLELENSLIDIFSVSETWLSAGVNSNILQLDGYNLIRCDRSFSDADTGLLKRGGVLNRLVQFNVIRHYVETNLFPYYS